MQDSLSSSKVDVLLCVGEKDIGNLFIDSMKSCLKNFLLLGDLYIVTSNKAKVSQLTKKLNLLKQPIILSDEEVIGASLSTEDGWYRQQIIKLQGYTVCKTKFFVCMSSDTILLGKIGFKHLFISTNNPIMYYKKHISFSPHYYYEKSRLKAIEKILKTPLINSEKYIDFILDFTLWDREILLSLHSYLFNLYGPDYYKKISPGKCKNLEVKKNFGEWTLYSAYVLDVLQHNPYLKNLEENYFTQIHSVKDLNVFNYNYFIVHFVKKDFDFQKIKEKIKPFLDN